MSSLFCERAELAIMVVYVLLQAHERVGTGVAGDAEVLGPGEGNRHIFFGGLLIRSYRDIVIQRLILTNARVRLRINVNDKKESKQTCNDPLYGRLCGGGGG